MLTLWSISWDSSWKRGVTTLPLEAPLSTSEGVSTSEVCCRTPSLARSTGNPPTFGGDVGFNIVKDATPATLFCGNIDGECPLVSFSVPSDIARATREALAKSHDEL